jgi:hypothetical protein
VPAIGVKPARQGREDTVKDINSYLEHRSRELSTLIRLLEQQRLHVRALEEERDQAHDKFKETVAAVNAAAYSLKDSLEKNGKPRDQAVISGFERNQKVLTELEIMAVGLRANYMNWRFAWEQYETTRDKAKALRAEIVGSPEY